MYTKRDNIYFMIIGTLGLIAFVLVNIFTKDFFSDDIKLFGLLLLANIIMQKINIRISDFTLTLDSAIMLCSYFLLGLIPTLWLITLTTIISSIFFHSLPKRLLFLDVGMFNLMFIITHYLFKVTGITLVSKIDTNNIPKFIIFGMIVFLTNWFFLYIQSSIKNNRNLPDEFKESFIWDFYTNLLVIPMSLLLTFSFKYYNYLGIVVFIALVILVNLFFRIVRNLVYMNRELKVVQEVSASISSKLELKETTTNILKGIQELVNCDYCAIIEVDSNKNDLRTIDFASPEEAKLDYNYVDRIINQNFKIPIEYKSSCIIDNIRKHKLIKQINDIPKDISSLIYVPLILRDEIKGFLLICSENRGQFFKEQLDILDTLANQAVIAIENARLYKDVKNKSIRDALTNLYNQRYFFDTLDSLTSSCSECRRSNCNNCRRTSLIIFDIDLFKQVNDTYGHQTGDKILKELAQVIANNVRSQDVVFRYGGEEFTIILPDTDQKFAYGIADRVRSIVENETFYTVKGEAIKLTISGGVSEFPYHAETGASLLAHADRAMYIGAKQKGRNKVSVYAS